MVIASWRRDGGRPQPDLICGLSPQRLRTRLSGDLDAIIAMAMRKELDRRYPSVEALADDANRHLGQPVRARQWDWRYNSAKFCGDTTMVAGVTAAFLGLALLSRRRSGRTIG
jgi:hypothetical protein